MAALAKAPSSKWGRYKGGEVASVEEEDPQGDEQHQRNQFGHGKDVVQVFGSLDPGNIQGAEASDQHGGDEVLGLVPGKGREGSPQGGGKPHGHGGPGDDGHHQFQYPDLIAPEIPESRFGIQVGPSVPGKEPGSFCKAQGQGSGQEGIEEQDAQGGCSHQSIGPIGQQEDPGTDDAVDAQEDDAEQPEFFFFLRHTMRSLLGPLR